MCDYLTTNAKVRAFIDCCFHNWLWRSRWKMMTIYSTFQFFILFITDSIFKMLHTNVIFLFDIFACCGNDFVFSLILLLYVYTSQVLRDSITHHSLIDFQFPLNLFFFIHLLILNNKRFNRGSLTNTVPSFMLNNIHFVVNCINNNFNVFTHILNLFGDKVWFLFSVIDIMYFNDQKWFYWNLFTVQDMKLFLFIIYLLH